MFTLIIKRIETLANKTYGENEEDDMSIRILSDHVRTGVFILGDQKGVSSNVGQGYILRRLIRRAVRHAHKLGIEGSFPFRVGRGRYRALQNPILSFLKTGSS